MFLWKRCTDGAHRILDEWHRTWSECIRPDVDKSARLHLNFVCDVADLETGRLAVAPLLDKSQPILAGCSIRLCERGNPDLQALAERTALTATGKSSSAVELAEQKISLSTFPFMKLPSELRFQILTYTDLVTPLREVEWNEEDGKYHRSKKGHFRDVTSAGDLHGYCELPNPARPWPSLKNSNLTCWESSFPHGCYCRAFHAAYSTIHQCECWTSPAPMFLVSRTMRQDALQVFFGGNRFIVVDQGNTWNAVVNPPAQLPISSFLRQAVPSDAFQFLRFPEIVFPPFGDQEPYAYCPPYSPQWNDLIRTLDTVKDKLDLPRLTMRVYFAPWVPEDYTSFGPGTEDKIRGQSDAAKQCYLDIAAPFKRLEGLQRFFAHLPDPVKWGKGEDDYKVWTLESLERKAETLVMGDDYDSEAAGKATLTPSSWLKDQDSFHPFTGVG